MSVSREVLEKIVRDAMQAERTAIVGMLRRTAQHLRTSLTRDPNHANHVGEIIDILADQVEQRSGK